MTFAIYIILVLGVFIGALNILPNATDYAFSFAPSITLVAGYMKAWDFLFPIHELITLVTAFVAFEISVWVWHVLWKVVKFLRGHSDGA